ncbi:hypothetical protein [Geminocystis sp. GBBB08]|uniref:hypothetical protein n=1 Tax=Geminocystis sp. GBBB08 TaxID=2604140 RepID=UPI0027E23D93|nr:hypothetical protein [Geminocystis sp. GBBB08]MBL1210633.1 hypothetical protein [Geminocystis sp. GBBB08]
MDNFKAKEKVFALLLMRFKVTPKDSLEITNQWFNNYPDKDWLFLETCLRNHLVRLENNQLINLYEERIIKIVNDLRGNKGLEIKDRKYRLTTYPLCFIGSEAVKWMEKNYIISKSEAITLGQELMDLKIIHHVTDDHNFKNDYLFYRFYLDE